jgi:hypothetical protein
VPPGRAPASTQLRQPVSIGISNAIGKAQQGPAQATGPQRAEVANPGFSTAVAVESVRLRLFTRGSLGLDLKVGPDVSHVAPIRRAAPSRLRFGVAACGDVFATAGAAQAAKCSASRARPLGGGCASSPKWVRIFSITGRSSMAAMSQLPGAYLRLAISWLPTA